MIKARTNIAAADSETRRMNDRANLDPEICRRDFQCRFDFGGVEPLKRAKGIANGLESRLVLGGEKFRHALPGVVKILRGIETTTNRQLAGQSYLAPAHLQR